MNVSRSKVDVKMHSINIKTSKKSCEFFESFEQLLFKSSKIYSNSLSTFIDYILNEINNFYSKYFESSKPIISTSTNRIFNLNSTSATIKAFENFDDEIEKIDYVSKKIDFAEKKSIQFLSNIASKIAKKNDWKNKSE